VVTSTMKNKRIYIVGALLAVSILANGAELVHIKIENKKVTFFEDRFGSYESWRAREVQEKQIVAQNEHTLTVYIKPEVPESQVLALKTQLEKNPDIQSVQYISADQALQEFKTKHQDDPLALQALQELGTNPLGATLTVSIMDPSQKPTLNEAIKAADKQAIIDKVVL
jgi:hypothetical protein